MVKGTKVYSMFASVNESAAAGGRINSQEVNTLVNVVMSSFHLENTPESAARRESGETRNKKIVSLENMLKKQLGYGLRVTSITKTAKDGSLYATIDGISDRGYYKVLPDFSRETVTILDKTLKQDLMLAAIQKVFENSKLTEMSSIGLNTEDMSFSVVSDDSQPNSLILKDYRINVELTENGLSWETEFDRHADFLRSKIEKYMKNLFKYNSTIYFASEEEFNDIEYYRKDNCSYYTAIYMKLSANEVCFTLEVNPWSDDIRIVGFKAAKDIVDDIIRKYGSENDWPLVSDYYFDVENQVIHIYLGNSDDTSDTSTEVRYKVHLDPETLEFRYTKL
jgi:hypothetical protein